MLPDADFLTRGRASAEELMRDTVRITRGGTRTLNDAGTAYVIVGGTTVYEGRCKVQTRGIGRDGEVEVAGREAVLYGTELHIPFSAPAVQVDDRALILTSQDPMLSGRLLRVAQLMYGTHKTARRLPVEDVAA